MSGNISDSTYRYQSKASMEQNGQMAYGAGTKKDVLNNHPIGKVVSGDKNRGGFLYCYVPSLAAIYGATKLFDKHVKGEYSNTFLGKLTKFGDELADTRVYKATIGKASDLITSAWIYTKNNIIPKSDILKALTNPMRPAWDLAKTNVYGINGFCGNYCHQLIENHATKKVHEIIGSQSEKIINATKVNGSLLNALHIGDINGLETSQVSDKVKDAILKRDFGLNLEQFKKLGQTAGKKTSLEAFRTAFNTAERNSVKIETENKFLFGKVKLGKSSIDMKSMANKISCLLGDSAKSGLGKNLARTPVYLLESLGNTAFGGKGAMFLAACFIAMCINGAIKKEKGDRLSTGAEELISWPAFFITMPAAALSAYGLAGLKYVGVSKENVNKYRDTLDAITKKNKEAGYATRKEYKDAIVKARKDFLVPAKRNLLTRIWHAPFRLAGKVLSIGLDNVKPWRNPNIKNGVAKWGRNFAIELPNNMKCFGGGMGRFFLIIAVTTPFFTKPFTVLSHLIFGKPKEEAEGEQAVAQTATPTPIVPDSLIEKYQKNHNSIATSSINEAEKTTPKRTYIPSPYAQETAKEKDDISIDKEYERILTEGRKAEKSAAQALKA